jgi:hypothetical protein
MHDGSLSLIRNLLVPLGYYMDMLMYVCSFFFNL